jgi:hypothetical protein
MDSGKCDEAEHGESKQGGNRNGLSRMAPGEAALATVRATSDNPLAFRHHETIA